MSDPLNVIDAILRQLDDAWGHKWESVRAVLAAGDEGEAAWQPPAHAQETPKPGWPPPGSIRWHVAHLAACKQSYARRIQMRGHPPSEEETPFAPGRSLAADLAALDGAHRHLRAAIAALAPADLADPVEPGMPLAEFLAMAIRHDTWHAGQMALVRRLYRTR
ncbi:MAG: DinB family protein [Planctomycetota bacterium]|nr:DinB family protein [Planctomycetota bacterium]